MATNWPPKIGCITEVAIFTAKNQVFDLIRHKLKINSYETIVFNRHLET